MAIYHFECKVIGRSSGRSVVAAAAYRAGTRLVDEETDEIKDYRRKGGIVFHEILLPENAPEEYRDQKILWNAVQKVEKRKDAQLAREVEVALPVELTRQQQIELVRNFIQKNFVSQGMIADWALHERDGNPHAHILLTVRGIDEQGKWMNKKRSIFANDRDQSGKPIYDPSKPVYNPRDKENTKQYRIPALDKNGNQKTSVREGHGIEYLWEKITIPANDWNDKGKVEEWRASWENCCNEYLEPENRINHRSYARQRIDRIPTIHEGYAARKMSQAGHVSERCEINKSIKEINDLNQEIKNSRDWISVRYLARAAMHCRKKAIDENDFSEMMKKFGYGVEWQHSSDKIIFIIDSERKITNARLGKCVNVDFSWETINQEFNSNKASTLNKQEISKKEETPPDKSERKKENTFISNEIPADTIVHMDGKKFSVQATNYDTGMVLLLDLTTLEKSGHSIERIESIENVMNYLHQPQKGNVQKPAAQTVSNDKAAPGRTAKSTLKSKEEDAQLPEDKAPEKDEDDIKVTEQHTESYYRGEYYKLKDYDKQIDYAKEMVKKKTESHDTEDLEFWTNELKNVELHKYYGFADNEYDKQIDYAKEMVKERTESHDTEDLKFWTNELERNKYYGFASNEYDKKIDYVKEMIKEKTESHDTEDLEFWTNELKNVELHKYHGFAFNEHDKQIDYVKEMIKERTESHDTEDLKFWNKELEHDKYYYGFAYNEYDKKIDYVKEMIKEKTESHDTEDLKFWNDGLNTVERNKYYDLKTNIEKINYAKKIIKEKSESDNSDPDDLKLWKEDLKYAERMAQIMGETDKDNIEAEQSIPTTEGKEILYVQVTAKLSIKTLLDKPETVCINRSDWIIDRLQQLQQKRQENHGYRLTPGEKLFFKRWEFTYFVRKPEKPQEEEKRLKEEVEKIQQHEAADAVIAEAVKQIEGTSQETAERPKATNTQLPVEEREEDPEKPEEPNNSPTATITQAVQTETEEETEEIDEIGEEEFKEWLQGFNTKHKELTDRVHSARNSADYISYEDITTIDDILGGLTKTYYKVYRKDTGDFQEVIHLYEVDCNLDILENDIENLETKLKPNPEPAHDFYEEEILSHGAR